MEELKLDVDDVRKIFSATEFVSMPRLSFFLFKKRRYKDVFFLDSWNDIVANEEEYVESTRSDFCRDLSSETYMPTCALVRDDVGSCFSYCSDGTGRAIKVFNGGPHILLCPSVNIEIADDKKDFLTKIFKDAPAYRFDDKKQAIIQIGEYPDTATDKDLNDRLEQMYKQDDPVLVRTGKTFSRFTDTASRSLIVPEFELDGKRYVRALVRSSELDYKVRWYSVQPVKFRVRNYGDLPTWLNPDGTGKSDTIELKCMKSIHGGYYYEDAGTLFKFSRWEKSFIRTYLNNGFINNGELDSSFGFFNEAFSSCNRGCREVTLPSCVKKLSKSALDGCDFDIVHLPSGFVDIFKGAFINTNLNYFVKEEGLAVYRNRPEFANTKNCICLSDLDSVIFDSYNYTKFFRYEDYSTLNGLIKNLKRSGLKIHSELLLHMVDKVVETGEVYNIKFLSQIVGPAYFEVFNKVPYSSRGFCKFMHNIGCFDSSYLLDKNHQPTKTVFAQKACNFLQQVIEDGTVTYGEVCQLGSCMTKFVTPSQEFLKFATKRGKDGKYTMFAELMEIARTRSDGFEFVQAIITNFDDVVSFRNGLNPSNKPMQFSWRDTFERYYSRVYYKNVNEQNQDIADLFSSMSIDEEKFVAASALRGIQIKSNINRHILRGELKEKTILETIEEIKADTSITLSECSARVQEAIEKSFTFEMLDKYDPANFIIGIYASCCASIQSGYYGAHIVKASVIERDVQNLVVRNTVGQIVAKGTMYVDRKSGFVVINDFEVNDKYDESEVIFEKNSKVAVERKKIFETLMRGIKAFVEQYDKENPSRPIKQVNVGLGFSDFKAICSQQYEHEKKPIPVPSKLSFKDAMKDQVVLYRRGEEMRVEVDRESFISII